MKFILGYKLLHIMIFLFMQKRIQDAFASKKRLSKEYEQLAIWYGDCDIEPRHDFSETLLPLSTRMDMESNNVQEEHDSESEWELL